MAITLGNIITSNDGTTGSFRDQVDGCRNTGFFNGKNIRTMSAWDGFFYLLRTDTETQTQTRYSSWVCDVPAVNGRLTRVRYTDTKSRTRSVYSNGVIGDWSVWSAWGQTAAVPEESRNGITCPYKTGVESQSETKIEYSGWVCDVPAANGRLTRRKYDYIRHRYRDTFSNGVPGAWGAWSGWSLTANTLEQAWNGNTCPYPTGIGTRHNYSGWNYSLPTGLSATGTRTRSYSITTWTTYSNGANGAESTAAQPNQTQTASRTQQHMGSSYYCSGQRRQNYNIYRNAFAFSDTTQYSGNYNINSGSPSYVNGYCGYVATKYALTPPDGLDVGGAPADYPTRTYFKVTKIENGVTTDITRQCSFRNVRLGDASSYISIQPYEGSSGSSRMRMWISRGYEFATEYPRERTSVSADVYYNNKKVATLNLLAIRRYDGHPYEPEM